MSHDRGEFMKLAGTAATVAGTAWAATPAAAQVAGQFRAIKALAFDAYGTLFDVFSVTALCEHLYPGARVHLGEFLGHQRRRLRWIEHILDSTQRRRSARRARFPGERSRQGETLLPIAVFNGQHRTRQCPVLAAQSGPSQSRLPTGVGPCRWKNVYPRDRTMSKFRTRRPGGSCGERQVAIRRSGRSAALSSLS